MFTMKSIAAIRLIFTLIFLLCANLAQSVEMLFSDHPLAGKIWDMNSHQYIDEAQLLALTNNAGILLLGETHDNPQHHELQMKLLKARVASVMKPGLVPALMMEQLNAESQAELDHALAGSNREAVLENVTKLIKFADEQMYQPFLSIAISNKMPVIAANVSNQKLQSVVWRGYAAYDAGELNRLGVETVWSESRQNYLVAHMGGAHCGKLREGLSEGLTRGQRLRDALMVDSAVASIGRGVVGIVGSSHARRDIGLPLYFAARAPSVRILSIGFIEVSPGVTDPVSYEMDSATGAVPYDVVWFTPRVARSDPCADISGPKTISSVSSVLSPEKFINQK